MTMQKRKKQSTAKVNGAHPADDEDVPRIAWHKLDIMTSLDLAEMGDSAGEMQVLAQALANGIATPEMVERLLELRDPARARAQFEKQLALLAKYVEYVPEDWFVETAPVKPDFRDPATYKELRGDKFGALWRLLAFGNAQAESVSGN